MSNDTIDIDAMVKQLTPEEGSRAFVYDDATGLPIKPGSFVQGHPTIGVGRCLDYSHGLSAAEINALLVNDIDNCFDTLMHYTWFTNLDAIRRRAMVDMCFNLGLAGLFQFHDMIDALSRKDFQAAGKAASQSLWYRQTGKRSQNVVNMILTGLV
jgi:lysozyme